MASKQKALSFLQKRQLIFAKMQRIYDFISEASKSNFEAASVRFDQIEALNSQFRAIQDSIIDHNSLTDKDDQLDVESPEIAFEDLVFASQMKFNSLKEKVQASSKNNDKSESAVDDVNAFFQTLRIPTFNGEIELWHTFYELFETGVHLTSLPEIRKFQLLRSLLRDEALKIIEHFPLTGNNYKLAYQALINRYQNARLLASHYLSKMLNYKITTLSTKDNLQAFLAAHKDSFDSFQALDIQDKTDFLFFHITYTHLDKTLQDSFDQRHDPTDIPSFHDLVTHVESILKYSEIHSAQDPNVSDKKPSYKLKSAKTHSLISKLQAPAKPSSFCFLCKSDHPLHTCPVFVNKTLQEKLDIVKQHKLCFNCLRNHFKASCRSTSRCRHCQRNHHSLLHDGARNASPNPEKSVAVLSSQIKNKFTSLLGTIQLLVKDSAQHLQPVRAVLDSGSQTSLMSSSCARRLGLKIIREVQSIQGVADVPVESPGIVEIQAFSRIDLQFKLSIEARVLQDLNLYLPTTSVTNTLSQQLQQLHLADPEFHTPSKIDLILGVNEYCRIVGNSPSSFIKGKPSAVETPFGWVLLGEVRTPESPAASVSLLARFSNLDKILKRFWEVEEIQVSPQANPEDIFCEEQFRKNVRRNPEGRYIVSLPFKLPAPPLGENRNLSLKNFIALERKLQKNPLHYKEYTAFMQDYLEQKHMVETEIASPYVIPQLVVFKDSSSTTKLRTVFNASSPDSHGISLNSRLLPGPKLQADITKVLLNFRFHRVALTADLRQMYRQILLHQEDQAVQHIFWRKNPSSPIKEYQLCTVTYGMTPSAFLAQRVLQQLMEDEGRQFPQAANAILQHRYIDDFITGADTPEEAYLLYKELTSLLSRGGFQLRKWSSNDSRVLERIPSAHQESPLVLDDNNSPVIKLLGLYWDPKLDCFQYQVQAFPGTPTKRKVLGYIARTFDPMGFLAPVIFWVKFFIQELWANQQDWDSKLQGKLLQDWQSFSAQLPALKNFKVPRCIPAKNSKSELIGFSDASEKGYAACVYLRVLVQKEYKSFLLKSKTKVAPLKKISIPRLELQGALLLAQLTSSILKDKPDIASKVHLFTDSQIVLAWLKLEPYKLVTFVANRVTQIQELFPSSHWNHVSSENNPADFASRGLTPLKFMSMSFWLEGPSFLQNVDLPSHIKSPSIQVIPDLKSSTTSLVSATPEAHPFVSWLERFSSLGKLKRVFAYTLRFAHNTRHKERSTGPPSYKEQEQAFLTLIKFQQATDFNQDLKNLNSGCPLRKPLEKLSPFLKDGVLRVGGRLKNSSLEPDAKHPILLSKSSHLSKLIIEDLHRVTGHSGPNLIQALLQQRYWILGARSAIRQVAFRCIKCARLRAKTLQPMMADLPAARVNPSRPFSQAGTDFAGPFWVKEGRRRNSPRTKGYLCVFVCFCTKAVHLEFVSALSTPAFLAALDRFIARRGCPADIYSDNGTNFVGASRCLKEVDDYLKSASDVLKSALSSRQINWHFQPPHAPHFGGLHEAAVKSAKRLLQNLTDDDALFFEEYCTLFSRVEAILNSRPLCALSPDPQESSDYLSPGHFLIGTSLLAPPESNLTDLTLHCRWQKLRQMTQHFWRKWSTSYLQALTSRSKWSRPASNIQVGHLVLVSDPSPPLRWPMGRVVSVNSGSDGVVRVASIKVGNGIFTRPVNKLIPLPVLN